MRNVALLILALFVLPPAAGASGSVAEVTGNPPRHAERIATLDFILTEIALAIGIDPVAVARPSGYREWVDIRSGQIADAVDLGLRGEPSLEALVGAKPDLVLGSTWRHGAMRSALGAIAPTVLYDLVPESANVDQLEQLRAIVRDLGERTGRAAGAEDALDAMDERFEAVRKRLAEAGFTGAPVVIAQHAAGTTRFNLYSQDSLGVAVAEAIGLRSTWNGESGSFGFETVPARTLFHLDDANALLMVVPGDSAFESLRASPVWGALPMVKEKRVHRLPPYTWFYGGPLSAARLAERFADALIGDDGSR